MASNLVPEQRMDKTGKLVTRHVRSDQRLSAAPAVPPPALGTGGVQEAPKKAFKPRAKQREPYLHSHRVWTFDIDYALVPEKVQRANDSSSAYYGVQASDVEVYDVFAAAGTPGNAMHLLSKGVRTYDEALAYLKSHKASHVASDLRGKTLEALEKNVPSFEFMKQYEELEEDDRKSANVVDIIRFKASPLDRGMNAFVIESISDGNIDFDDIKAVGVSRLQPFNRLSALSDTFSKLKSGEADYSADDIKQIIDRASDQNLDSKEFRAVADMLAHKGIACVGKFDRLENLAIEYYNYRSGSWAKGKNPDEDVTILERIEYAGLIRDKLSRSFRIGFSDQFFEAGIPVEVAIDIVGAGGGLREALAIHDHGTAPSVAGGWL